MKNAVEMPLKTDEEILKERKLLLHQQEQHEKIFDKAKSKLENSTEYIDFEAEKKEKRRIEGELKDLDMMLKENYQLSIDFQQSAMGRNSKKANKQVSTQNMGYA